MFSKRKGQWKNVHRTFNICWLRALAWCCVLCRLQACWVSSHLCRAAQLRLFWCGVRFLTLLWRHNEFDGVSNHQPQPFIKFGRWSKKTLKLRVTGLCVGNSPMTGEFPAQITSYAKNVSIWWRHHVDPLPSLAINDCECFSLIRSHSLKWRVRTDVQGGIKWLISVLTSTGRYKAKPLI